MTDILLVEDHQELNELMRMFLAREGYCVHGVSSGEEALLWLADHRVKLVILDVSLPEMDGFAVCARIREYSGCLQAIRARRCIRNTCLIRSGAWTATASTRR